MFVPSHRLTRLILASGLLLLVLSGCGPYQVANPQFDDCAGKCAKSQTDCMTNATDTKEIRVCKDKQQGCVETCEMRFPRYIEQK
ncbi:MAG: hypothetical protein OEV94_10985 [Deltaproteobacteria bacterium]|nr:hypothetical protein [Deltaproteobacteria bacterium]